MGGDFDQTFIEYEEDSAETGVYKFDHEPICDGSWHDLNADYSARYRITGDRLQYLNVRAEPTTEAQARLVRFLESMPPLFEERTLETWLGCDDTGYFARDYTFETDGPNAARLSTLSVGEMRRAIEEAFDLAWADDD